MQVHRELFIRGEPEKLDAVGEDIRRSLADGWARDADAEEHMRSMLTGHPRHVYCFASPKRPRRPSATLFLLNQNPHTLYVTNVVPHEHGELSYDQYNAIVEDFFRKFAEPAARRNEAVAELTEPKADLERWLPAEAAEKLRIFCATANKTTGSSHPSDRERWYEFIVAAQDAEAEFTASTLARWLFEEGGWDAELANKLACEYEFARGLLTFANGARMRS